MKRLCVVTTTDLIVRCFLRDLLRELSTRYEVTLVVNTDDPHLLSQHGIQARLRPLRIARKIAPAADFLALIRLLALFLRGHYDGVVSIAPKAGLLTAVAAWISRIPFRCHVFQGEVWATSTGVKRSLLKLLDRLVAELSTDILAVSRSQRDFLEREKVLPAGQAQLVHRGSLCGVEVERFHPNSAWRSEVRLKLGIPQHGFIILFLGRIARDKGVIDLVQAFRAVAGEYPDAFLVYAGPDEDDLSEIIRQSAGDYGGRLRFLEYTEAPERSLAGADLVALPSYREGFGNVLIEAAAAGIPTLASGIPGIEDAVVHGETGLLHDPRDARAIAEGLRQLLQDSTLRTRLGMRGHERAVSEFSSRDVLRFWTSFLEQRV
jgi:glycosyltransferase involved in cell wall biosynthesis